MMKIVKSQRILNAVSSAVCYMFWRTI